jgi:ABC-type uncharacterized transport system auxiliary subunit
MKLALVALALVPFVSGCISLLPKAPPPPRIYSMEAAPPVATKFASKPVVIAVGQPSTSRALAGSDIAWSKDGQLAYVGGATWAGRGPDLLQTVLVHTIDRSGLVTGAVRSGEGRADSEIGWDVVTFGVVEEGGVLEGRLIARAKLFGARDRMLLSALEIDERAALRDRSTTAGAAALEQAARNASVKIAEWAARNTPERLPSARTAPERTREPLVEPDAPKPEAPVRP